MKPTPIMRRSTGWRELAPTRLQAMCFEAMLVGAGCRRPGSGATMAYVRVAIRCVRAATPGRWDTLAFQLRGVGRRPRAQKREQKPSSAVNRALAFSLPAVGSDDEAQTKSPSPARVDDAPRPFFIDGRGGGQDGARKPPEAYAANFCVRRRRRAPLTTSRTSYRRTKMREYTGFTAYRRNDVRILQQQFHYRPRLPSSSKKRLIASCHAVVDRENAGRPRCEVVVVWGGYSPCILKPDARCNHRKTLPWRQRGHHLKQKVTGITGCQRNTSAEWSFRLGVNRATPWRNQPMCSTWYS